MNNMSKHWGLAGNVASFNSPVKWINFQSEAESQTDTTLRLVSLGPSNGTKRKWEDIDGGTVSGRDSLVLGLRCSPSTSESSKKSSEVVSIVSSTYVADEECSIDLDLNIQLELETESVCIPMAPVVTPLDALVSKPALILESSLYVGSSVSAITSEVGTPAQHLINRETSTVSFSELVMDDGSISSCRRQGSCQIPYMKEVSKNCTPGNIRKQNRSSSTKICQFVGCEKGARGASGRCIGHGGGRRCQRAYCEKGAEGKSIYCKLHGGGRRCEELGCLKSAEGSTNFCIRHGGGRRCSFDGCPRASRGKSGLCIKHGGGRRCKEENCTKSAEGRSGLCIAHGGGKRCQYKECTKGAQGSTMFCKAHGGGKRCSITDCNKGAEGSTPFCKRHGGGKRCLFRGSDVCSKSVHGGTQFCVAHGGGKRCATPECTKSARGRTDYCVRHGGGKRCQLEGCSKSAQGRTNFCKAHGDGKRCAWKDQAGTDIGSVGSSCDRFSKGKNVGLCAGQTALVQDHQVHGGKMMGTPTAQKPAAPAEADKMKVIVVEEPSLFSSNDLNQMKFVRPIIPVKHGAVSIPEGRVHGGGLMALLSKGASLNHSESQAEGCSTSNQGSSHTMNYGCL